MKKIFYTLISIAIFCFAQKSGASTSITASSVSGHWTLAGSPYLVFNDIQVDVTQSLIIDAGVDISFQGNYRLNVLGILSANGTMSQPINFHVNDTTGWADVTTSVGGWHGIQFQNYHGTAPDVSCLQYCNISQTKFDSLDLYVTPYQVNALCCFRNLKVTGCNFFQNNSIWGDVIYLSSNAGQQIEMAGCNIYDNTCRANLVINTNYTGGNTYFHNCSVYQNTAGCIFSGIFLNLLLANNDFYQNSATDPAMGIITVTGPGSRATIKGNNINHNTSTNDAAIFCTCGVIDINRNFICNNQHVNGVCGAVDGGGGINIEFNAAGSPDTTSYLVRNNIIANNYSPFHGGGINVRNTKATISNNLIINNSSFTGGAIYVSDTFPLIIKNNIFFGNVNSSGDPLVSANVDGISTSSIEYDHNWTQHSTYLDLRDFIGMFTLLGDTTTNVFGTNPGIVAPTLTSTVTENALTATFSLLATSPCINMGDTATASADSVDYAGNPRICGSAIDMGPYEFNPVLISLHAPINAAPEKALNIFPNPASKMIFVSTPDAKGTLTIEDISGSIIAESKITATLTSIDIHTFPRGIYFAVWNDGNGNKTTQKIIAE